MQLKKKHFIAIASFGALMLNMVFASTVFGQSPTGLQIGITRTPYLSFVSLPPSFRFPSATAALGDTQIFSDPNGPLNPATRVLGVQDTRNSGGITVQAQATDFISTTNPSHIIPASKLRIVTTSSFSGPLDTVVVNNVHYASGFQGTPDFGTVENIQAPLNAATTDFSDVATFDNVETTVGSTKLNAPVDILVGCLTPSEGRNGIFGVGISYNLDVPGYTLPEEYASTITYTVTDNTQPVCP